MGVEQSRACGGGGTAGEKAAVQLGEFSGGSAQAASGSVRFGSRSPELALFFQHRNGWVLGWGGKEHVGSTGRLQDIFQEKGGPRLLGMPRKPLTEKPPSASRVIRGLSRLQGEVAGLGAG